MYTRIIRNYRKYPNVTEYPDYLECTKYSDNLYYTENSCYSVHFYEFVLFLCDIMLTFFDESSDTQHEYIKMIPITGDERFRVKMCDHLELTLQIQIF